ncbi:MAG: hypothetical protein WC712_13255 [Candidatus Brocadiia bacterium]
MLPLPQRVLHARDGDLILTDESLDLEPCRLERVQKVTISLGAVERCEAEDCGNTLLLLISIASAVFGCAGGLLFFLQEDHRSVGAASVFIACFGGIASTSFMYYLVARIPVISIVSSSREKITLPVQGTDPEDVKRFARAVQEAKLTFLGKAQSPEIPQRGGE